MLNNESYGLFAVIPCRGEEEAEYFIEILEQSVDMKREWACGVSKIKHGFGDLREAYQEAGQALRYHQELPEQEICEKKEWLKQMTEGVVPGVLDPKGAQPARTIDPAW